MITKEEVESNVRQFINKIEKISESQIKKHGSYFREKNKNAYLSDIDVTVLIDECSQAKKLINFLCKDKNFYLKEILCGDDRRFKFSILSKNINLKKIKSDLEKYKKNKVLSDEEFNKLSELVKETKLGNISLLAYQLRLVRNIPWTINDIKNNKTIFRGIEYDFCDNLKKSFLKITGVFIFKNKFPILFDISVKRRDLPREEDSMFYNMVRYYYTNRYFKFVNKLKGYLRKNLKEISDKKTVSIAINRLDSIHKEKRLKCIYQIIIRIDVILILIKYKNLSDIRKYIIQLRNDSIQFCKYNFVPNLKKNSNYEIIIQNLTKKQIIQKLKEYKNQLNQYMNDLIEKELLSIYKKIESFLPAKINI